MVYLFSLHREDLFITSWNYFVLYIIKIKLMLIIPYDVDYECFSGDCNFLKKDFLHIWRILFTEVGKMLVDTSITIAYKCSCCGSFEFYNISLFMLLSGRENRFNCRCGKSEIIIGKNNDGYLVKIPCIGCGNEHVYVFGRKDVLEKGIIAFNCPETGIQLSFIGKDEQVRKKVDSMEKELDQIADMFGYESYFNNTQVMLDSLNKIHDIAEQGNLSCECGSSDIELLLLPDMILLKCRRCFTENTILAATNKDLRETLLKKYILVTSDSVDGDKGKVERLCRKTDGK